MIAYIQTDLKGNMNRAIMKYGMDLLGIEVVEAGQAPEEIKDEEIFYGNANWIGKILKNTSYNVPSMGNIPYALLPLAGRTLTQMHIDEAIKRAKESPLFIKPIAEKHKYFTGFVLSKPSQLVQVKQYEWDVIASDPINILTEYRCFIHQREIVDAKRYKGDFRLIPDFRIVDTAIALYGKTAPIAYSCDVGLTDKGETIIVECNDMMSLGLYGLDPLIAAKMLTDRWEEIHQLNKK